jgi:hypothetical protein
MSGIVTTFGFFSKNTEQAAEISLVFHREMAAHYDTSHPQMFEDFTDLHRAGASPRMPNASTLRGANVVSVPFQREVRHPGAAPDYAESVARRQPDDPKVVRWQSRLQLAA